MGKDHLIMPAEENKERSQQLNDDAEIDDSSQQCTGIGKSSRTQEILKDRLVLDAVGAVKSRKKVAKDTMLIPPSCMRIMMMICPFSVKWVAVSTVVSPVTQLALVEVKRASIKRMPEWVISGSHNNNVPAEIRIMNERVIRAEGPSSKRRSLWLALPDSNPTMMKK